MFKAFSELGMHGRHELARVGNELGFSVEVSDNGFPSVFTPVATIRGVIDGGAVAVQRFPHKRGFSDRAAAAIWPPLDLGLSLRLEGKVTGAVRNLFGSEDVKTGDEAFDGPLRVQADEPARVVGLLDARVRHKLHWFAGSCEEFELTDHGIRCFSSGFYGPRNWLVELPALVDAARSVLIAGERVPPPAALAHWAASLHTIGSSYGLRMRTCPLSAEGDLGNLRCGIFFRRLAKGGKGRYAVELGAVIAPLGPFRVSIQPRRPRIDVDEFQLAKPTETAEIVPYIDGWVDPRVAATFVIEAVKPRYPDVRAAISSDMLRKMVELQEHFDVGIRHGVLTLRRAITATDTPSQLAGWIDLAADGARTVVRQAAAGYRD